MTWFFRSNVSFSRQLTEVFVMGIVVLAVVSSLAISWMVTRAEETVVAGNWLEISNNFAAQSRDALLHPTRKRAEKPVRMMFNYPDVRRAAIFDADLRIVFDEGTSPDELEPGWHRNLSRGGEIVHESGEAWYFASKVREEAVHYRDDASQTGQRPLGYVLVAVGKAALHENTRAVFLINTVIALTIAAVLLLILRFITRRLTTPLDMLSTIMRRAEEGETGMRADFVGPKDIVDMGAAFNKMMIVLEEREKELKSARDAALETARMKAEFAAIVSHEIRTPLNGVLGMLNLLKELGVPHRLNDYLNVAIKSGDELMALINDILDFSKMEAGKLAAEPVEFNLRECIENLAALYAETEKAYLNNIELCVRTPPDLPVRVKGDPVRLRQVLNNLLNNAFKFTRQGQVVFRVSHRDAGNGRVWVDFVVDDEGIGIAPESQSHIFEAFTRGQSTPAGHIAGTGLGLAICRRLVEVLGGELTVESEPERGSRFSFSIPMDVVERGKVEPFLEGRRVLIVESNAVNRASLAETIESFGGQCTVCATGPEALEVLAASQADRQARFTVCVFNVNACQFNVQGFIGQAQHVAKASPLKMVMLARPRSLGTNVRGIHAKIFTPVQHSVFRARLEKLMFPGKGRRTTANERDEKRANHSDFSVLIVDDNRTNQLVTRAMLIESGFKADIATNGLEAVVKAKQSKYDLVLMDCCMPVMDGYEATTHIRSIEGAGGRVTIFAMTAIDNPGDIQRCLDVGMDDILIKPVTLDGLREKLREYFNMEFSGRENQSTEDTVPSVDGEVLANLERTLGHKLGEILEAFLEDARTYLQQLHDSVMSAEWSKVAAAAHNLKGSSRSLGAIPFASICREIEETVVDDGVGRDYSMKLIEDLSIEFKEVEKVLRRKLVAVGPDTRKPASGKAEIVLVVDDDRITRLAIGNALTSEGVSVEYASDGEEAIDAFIELSPDLVILDAMMPKMDGFTACREIIRLPGGRETPILIVTVMDNEESVELAFAAGATDFIGKPLNLAVLRRRVKRVLDARQSEERIRLLAYHDSLTGLPNRIAFSERLKQEMAYAKRNNKQLAVLFIDLDLFKDVNDNLGHAAGDVLLKNMAKRLSGGIRSEDTLARLGGDEFVIILSSVDGPRGVDTVAKTIFQLISAPFQIAGREIHVGASIGIALYPTNGVRMETLLKNADTAMYRAKELGRNNYQFYTEDMGAAISERIDLESDLRRSLEREELLLYYQPKIDIRTGTIIGAEALVRWEHPERGFILPDNFISVAEESGVIGALGSWVMQRACAQLEQWRSEASIAIQVAVNVSARQFKSPDFVDEVAKCFEFSGLPPEMLELEITEGTILEYETETIEKLKILSEMGVKIAIDDFGVGYSSFSYLKRLPVNVLKIDKSFVQDMVDDASGAALVDGMIGLAHNLGLEVVAEGVESQAQYAFLQRHKCDIIQGYFVGQPVPAAEFFETYLTNQQRHQWNFQP